MYFLTINQISLSLTGPNATWSNALHWSTCLQESGSIWCYNFWSLHISAKKNIQWETSHHHSIRRDKTNIWMSGGHYRIFWHKKSKIANCCRHRPKPVIHISSWKCAANIRNTGNYLQFVTDLYLVYALLNFWNYCWSPNEPHPHTPTTAKKETFVTDPKSPSHPRSMRMTMTASPAQCNYILGGIKSWQFPIVRSPTNGTQFFLFRMHFRRKAPPSNGKSWIRH